MSAEFIKLYEANPNRKQVEKIVNVLRDGGLIIIPTDTIYGFSCDIYNHKAIERLRILKGKKSKSLNYSFLCQDLSDISKFAKVDTPTFKVMKKALPGPYTFILPASSAVPKILNIKKKTIGIRVPDNNISRELVSALGNPLISSSIHSDDVQEYVSDPEEIYDAFHSQVDIIVDGGYGDIVPSTIIDFSEGEPRVMREGKGEIDVL